MPRKPLPMPMGDPAVDLKTGKFTNSWTDFFLQVTLFLSQAPQRIGGREWVGQHASMPPTPIATTLQGVGLYRVTYTLRIVQAATTSSSVSLQIAWIDEGTGAQVSSAALTTNTVHDVLSGTVFARADSAASITVATTYASVGAQAMWYDLDVSLELIA